MRSTAYLSQDVETFYSVKGFLSGLFSSLKKAARHFQKKNYGQTRMPVNASELMVLLECLLLLRGRMLLAKQTA